MFELHLKSYTGIVLEKSCIAKRIMTDACDVCLDYTTLYCGACHLPLCSAECQALSRDSHPPACIGARDPSTYAKRSDTIWGVPVWLPDRLRKVWVALDRKSVV